jgi:membrane-bound lytic murein transglycosylase A
MADTRRNVLGYLVMALILAVIFTGAFILSRVLPEPEGFAEISSIRKSWMLGEVSPKAQDLESWTDLRPAIEKSLEFLSAKPNNEVALSTGDLELTWGQLRRSLMELELILPKLDERPSLLAERFAWLQLGRKVLMTGYYAPLVQADSKPSEEYPYPLYGVPDDLKSLDLGKFHRRWQGQKLMYRLENGEPVPFYGRDEIDFQGALDGRDLEVAWAKDLVDVFFLHIQGSGILEYPDGNRRYILYAGKNGRDYVSLGREMIERGMLERDEVSMHSIRDYLDANPDQKAELLSTNPSYVFFKLGDDGPFGAMGRELTPRVSVATDPKVLPLGSLLLLRTQFPPQEPGGKSEKLAGLVLAQDTGGAIKGDRLDFYSGMGRKAEYMAGHLKADATVALLISKSVL